MEVSRAITILSALPFLRENEKKVANKALHTDQDGSRDSSR